MNILQPIFALPRGLVLCLQDDELRRLSRWPWLVGIATYLFVFIGSYYLHPILLSKIIDPPITWWQTILYFVAWLAVTLFLLLASSLSSVIVVVITTAVFQTAIATRALQLSAVEIPNGTSGLRGIMNETARTITTEIIKFLWLAPVFLTVAILGLIPLLMPLALTIAAWLLAFQFIDIVLDVLHYPTRDRFAFSIRNTLMLLCFGLTLTIAWAIRFLVSHYNLPQLLPPRSW